jgi:hypothetical protein
MKLIFANLVLTLIKLQDIAKDGGISVFLIILKVNEIIGIWALGNPYLCTARSVLLSAYTAYSGTGLRKCRYNGL